MYGPAGSAIMLLPLGQLAVAAEFVAERRQELVGEARRLARPEAGEQRRRQHMGRHRLLDRRIDRPAALAGILDHAGIALEALVLRQRLGGEIEKPRADDAAAPPQLGNVGEVEIVSL